MGKIDKILLMSEDMDEDGNLNRKYKVEATGLNVDSVKTAYTEDGKRLPQRYEPDPYSPPHRKSIVSKINAKIRGDQESEATQLFEVDIKYTKPTNEDSDDFEEDEYKFPWDKPTEFSSNSDSIEVDLWGSDLNPNSDVPLQHSNGEPVNLTTTIPLQIFSFSRNVKVGDSADSLLLAKNYNQSVNDGIFSLTIYGQLYNFSDASVLVSSVNAELDLFRYVNQLTGAVRYIPYYKESLELIYNPKGWRKLIVDQGTVTKVPNRNYMAKRVNPNDKEVESPTLLNGAGLPLLSFNTTGLLRDIENTPATGTTPFGVPIDDDATSKASNRLVFLTFQTYRGKDFSGLGLDSGFTL